MNFRLSKSHVVFLVIITLALGIIQVTTPLFLRTLIDGVIPSKDGHAIAYILIVIAINELLLIFTNMIFNKQLDELEKEYIGKIRVWMLLEVTKNNHRPKDQESFYQVWSNQAKQLVYKKIKNPWYRAKDFLVLVLLTFICLNISYLAGFLIIIISILSILTVKYFQDSQGETSKKLHQKNQEEKVLFQDYILSSTSQREAKLTELQKSLIEINDLQFDLTKERSRYLDINNFIRFTVMFSILGIGGYLFATSSLSMGSLWALLITMYRITPSLQSIIRWILQSKMEDNLEERILQSLKTVEVFKKPGFYNRLVKIIESHLSNKSSSWILVKGTISRPELIKSLELWKSFYSQRNNIEIISELPEVVDAAKSYFFIGKFNGKPFSNLLVFNPEEDLPPPDFTISKLE